MDGRAIFHYNIPYKSGKYVLETYLVPERKLWFFFKIKPPAHRAYAPEGKTKILTTGIRVVFRGLKFESDADIRGKDSFRSGTI